MAALLMSDVLTMTRTLLNDDGNSLWTDAVLIPKIQIAHRELQSELWSKGSPVVKEVTAPILVTAGATTLGASQPADLLAPTQLMEGAASSGVAFSPMTEVSYIPVTVAQTTTLIYWAWRNEIIKFLGSTASRYVIVFYRKLITVPTIATSSIGILSGELYLAPRAAALAAGAVGNKEVYTIMTDLAKSGFAKVMEAHRGCQTPMNTP